MDMTKVFIALFAVALLAGVAVYIGAGTSGAVVQQPTSGTVCCTFDRNGVEKTCVAPEGQGCDTCKAVCAEVNQ